MSRTFKPWTPATAELELLHECWLARLPPARIAARLGISEPKLKRFMRRVHAARGESRAILAAEIRLPYPTSPPADGDSCDPGHRLVRNSDRVLLLTCRSQAIGSWPIWTPHRCCKGLGFPSSSCLCSICLSERWRRARAYMPRASSMCAGASLEPLPESCSDFSATFTTIAFDDSSSRWLEINT